MESCKNCQTVLQLENKFCPNCGQKTQANFTLGLLFKDTISNYLSIDSRFFKSLIPLIFKPGYLAKTYTAGKRQMYMHPAKFYFFSSILLFLLLSLSMSLKSMRNLDEAADPQLSEQNTITKDSLDKGIIHISDDLLDIVLDSTQIIGGEPFSRLDSLRKTNGTKFDKLKALGWSKGDSSIKKYTLLQIVKLRESDAETFLGAMIGSVSIGLFFLIPFFSLLLKFYFRKNKKPYVDHLVFTLYSFTFLFFTLSLLFTIRMFVELPSFFSNIISFAFMVHLMLSIKIFYDRTYIRSFSKMILVLISFFVVLIPFTILVLAITAVGY